MEIFKDKLLKVNPHLSQNSIKTYFSLVKNMHHRVFKSIEIDYNNFEKDDKIIDYLNESSLASKKTILSALWLLTKNTKFQKAMLIDIKTHEEQMSTNSKNTKQQHNWIEQDELKEIISNHEKIFNLLVKTNMNKKETIQAQNFILLMLTTGIFFPPRRSLDWISLKISNINRDTDNYINFRKKLIVFNRFKGSITKGQQNIPLIPIVAKAIQLFVKKRFVVESDFLLNDSKGTSISNVQLTQFLNNIFKKNVSTSMLRHFYVSNKFKGVDELQKIAIDMGTSVNMLTNDYMKK
jgi:hypothetical protein